MIASPHRQARIRTREALLAIALAAASTGCNADRVLPPAAARMAKISGDNQVGVVNTALPSLLAVRIASSGVPEAGVRIYWRAEYGPVLDSSLTNAEGVATFQRVLGVRAGSSRVLAYGKASDSLPTLAFGATAMPADPATITLLGADAFTAPLNTCLAAFVVGVRVADRFGNSIVAPVARWEVLEGPVMIPGDLSALGQTRQLESTGITGVGRVQASVPGLQQAVTFTITMTPARYNMVMLPDQYDDVRVVSGQRCVVDDAEEEIPAGETVYWVNHDRVPRQIVSVGSPAFPATPVIAAGDSAATVFTEPGTYRFAPAGTRAVVGTFIVR